MQTIQQYLDWLSGMEKADPDCAQYVNYEYRFLKRLEELYAQQGVRFEPMCPEGFPALGNVSDVEKMYKRGPHNFLGSSTLIKLNTGEKIVDAIAQKLGFSDKKNRWCTPRQHQIYGHENKILELEVFYFTPEETFRYNVKPIPGNFYPLEFVHYVCPDEPADLVINVGLSIGMTLWSYSGLERELADASYPKYEAAKQRADALRTTTLELLEKVIAKKLPARLDCPSKLLWSSVPGYYFLVNMPKSKKTQKNKIKTSSAHTPQTAVQRQSQTYS